MRRASLGNLLFSVVGLAIVVGSIYLVVAAPPSTQADARTVEYWVAPVVAWLALIAWRLIRYPRPVIATAILTAIWLASPLFGGDASRLVSGGVALLFVAGLMWPDLFWLRARGTARADRLIRTAATYLRGTDLKATETTALAATLERDGFPFHSGPWAVAATLFRQVLLRQAGVTSSQVTSEASFQVAAIGFWRAALAEGSIRPPRPDAWAQSQALRCYTEELNDLLPDDWLEDPPSLEPGSPGGDRAERLIDELRATSFHDAVGDETREGLVRLMVSELALARGIRTKASIAEQETSFNQVSELFAKLDQQAEAVVARRAKDVAA